jgi:UDP-glucose 4-epimerase
MVKQKTALVTGGAGFIGSHLVKALMQHGYAVVSLDDYLTGTTANHHTGATYITGETKDVSSLITTAPDIVYHLGEYPRVEQSFEDVEAVLESNVVGTHQVLEFCRKHKVKLVYAGSSTKFADSGIGRDQSPYAWSKATNTDLVKNYGEWFGLPYAITYFYNVYGPGERSDIASGTVIAIFAEQYKHGKPLTVRSPGTQRRNFTHVADIVNGLLLVGDRGEGDEYGLGHQRSYSILEVARMFSNDITMLPERAGNRMGSSVDLHRAELELCWEPTHDLPTYIKEIKERM